MNKQKLIADCTEEIESLEKRIARMKEYSDELDTSRYESKLKRQKIALASLEAEPVGEVVDVGGARMVEWERCISEGEMVYTAPPAPVDLERDAMRKLVDVVWSDAAESPTYLSTEWADRLIDQAFPGGIKTVPAPVDFSALVPDARPVDLPGKSTYYIDKAEGWNEFRAEMLRRIEEIKK